MTKLLQSHHLLSVRSAICVLLTVSATSPMTQAQLSFELVDGGAIAGPKVR